MTCNSWTSGERGYPIPEMARSQPNVVEGSVPGGGLWTMGSRLRSHVRLVVELAAAGKVDVGRRRGPGDLSRHPPQVQNILRAMQTHGLIVADNGSDLYVSGTMDSRWNNEVLNPAFRV